MIFFISPRLFIILLLFNASHSFSIIKSSRKTYYSFLKFSSVQSKTKFASQLLLSEIKAELSLRSVDYSDCFDKESLINKLAEARKEGKADPSLLNEFNKKKLESNMKGKSLSDISDEDISRIVGGDGNLP